MSLFQAWPANAPCERCCGPPPTSPCLQPPYSKLDGSFWNAGLGPHALLQAYLRLPFVLCFKPTLLSRTLGPSLSSCLPPAPAVPVIPPFLMCPDRPHVAPIPSTHSFLLCSLHSAAPALKESPLHFSGQPILFLLASADQHFPLKASPDDPQPHSVSQFSGLCFLLLHRCSPHWIGGQLQGHPRECEARASPCSWLTVPPPAPAAPWCTVQGLAHSTCCQYC